MTNFSQYLTFMMRDQFYGVPIASVREINRYVEVTPIPQTPLFIAGVMNLRGKVIPVLNLREKFGMPPVATSKETCIIVMETEHGHMGVIVDAVRSVVNFNDSQIDPTPRLGDSSIESFILGIGKIDDHVVVLINVFNTLSKENLSQVLKLGESSSKIAS